MDLWDRLAQLNKPVPKNQDGTCPYIKWMLEDHRCPGWGEYKCLISTYKYGEYYDYNTDYNECNCKDHNICDRYKKHNTTNKENKK